MELFKDKGISRFSSVDIGAVIFYPEDDLEKIGFALNKLQDRIKFLLNKRKQIIKELAEFKDQIIPPKNLGFVLVIKYSNDTQKQKLIDFCKANSLPFTLCPRYIRLNQPAVCIEIKQLKE